MILLMSRLSLEIYWVSLLSIPESQSPVGGHKTEYLVSGSRDKTIKLWNVGSGQCIATFNEHDNWVRSVCFHPSGHYIISASEDRSIRIVDLSKGRSIRVLDEAHSHFVTSVCQHNTLPYLVSGSVDKEIHVWDCRWWIGQHCKMRSFKFQVKAGWRADRPQDWSHSGLLLLIFGMDHSGILNTA